MPPALKRATCGADGCVMPASAKAGGGLCDKHYARWRRLGSTERRTKAWTEVQKTNLRRIYEAHPAPHPLPPAAELEAILGHSMSSIAVMASKLGATTGKRTSLHRLFPDRNCAVCGEPFRPACAEQLSCSPSCGRRHAIATHGHPRGMTGKQHTDSTKAQISTAGKAVWARATAAERKAMTEPMHSATPYKRTGNTFSRTRSGKRADLDDLFVRSSWEANYARYLNWLVAHNEIESWEYEPQQFLFPVVRGNRTYTPDFRVVLPRGDVEWHEVKGWMTNDSRIKLQRFARHYPDEVLVLIDAPVYRSLSKSVGPLIANWES